MKTVVKLMFTNYDERFLIHDVKQFTREFNYVYKDPDFIGIEVVVRGDDVDQVEKIITTPKPHINKIIKCLTELHKLNDFINNGYDGNVNDNGVHIFSRSEWDDIQTRANKLTTHIAMLEEMVTTFEYNSFLKRFYGNMIAGEQFKIK